jgi:hypothetical protein
MPSGIPGSGGQCGTYSGYNRHRKENTPLCDACKQADREYRARWRSEHPESAARARHASNQTSQARRRALTLLKKRYPDEYQRIYRGVLAARWEKEKSG